MHKDCSPNLALDANTASLTVTMEEAEDFVIKRSKELVQELVTQRDRETPPFLAKEFADLRGIEIKKANIGKISALLVRTRDSYLIKVNEDHHPVRQNFSCAHEIGHTFLHELNRSLEVDSGEFRLTNSGATSKAKERLCDIVAAELLMPKNVFQKYLAGFGLSINSIERLASVFHVSTQAAAIRISQVSTEPCYAILWRQCQRPRSRGFLGYFMRNKVYLRNPSPVSQAFESDKVVKTRKTFQISVSKKEQFGMESKAFGLGETRYVISLVFPSTNKG